MFANISELGQKNGIGGSVAIAVAGNENPQARHKKRQPLPFARCSAQMGQHPAGLLVSVFRRPHIPLYMRNTARVDTEHQPVTLLGASRCKQQMFMKTLLKLGCTRVACRRCTTRLNNASQDSSWHACESRPSWHCDQSNRATINEQTYSILCSWASPRCIALCRDLDAGGIANEEL